MSDIERELREKLRRKQPPAGFGHRVVQRVVERAAQSESSYRRRWKRTSMAAAACLAIVIAGAYWQRQQRAERAHEQLVQALQITAQELALVERVAVENLVQRER